MIFHSGVVYKNPAAFYADPSFWLKRFSRSQVQIEAGSLS